METNQPLKKYEDRLRDVHGQIDQTGYVNQRRILQIYRQCQLREDHFRPGTGYGYGDAGRDLMEEVFARVMGAENALVRSGIVSGTHALALCLSALTRSGDEVVSLTGPPYDTLQQVIGTQGASTVSLLRNGVKYQEVPLSQSGRPRIDLFPDYISKRTQVALVQRSRGYSWRPAIGCQEIAEIAARVKEINPQTIILVDNCYGELVEEVEPCAVGADLVAGSLIKNPGGGLVPAGGYVAGRSKLVEPVAERLTAPGLGKEVGPTLIDHRLLFQGLFMAPATVAAALKGASLLALVMEELGYAVSPGPFAARHDIVQAVELGSPEAVLKFCQTVQMMSPVDSQARLEYGDMPGYTEQVVMAAGTFVQGSSIELSCDAPLRPPYIAYWQGGLTYEHAKCVIEELYRQFG